MGTKNDLWWRTTLLFFHSYIFMFMRNKNISPCFISNKMVMGKKLVCVPDRWCKSGTKLTLPLALEDSNVISEKACLFLEEAFSYTTILNLVPILKLTGNMEFLYGGRFSKLKMFCHPVFLRKGDCLLVLWNEIFWNTWVDFIEHILYQKFRIKYLTIQSIDKIMKCLVSSNHQVEN